ncbi:MAG: GNAT family N-acetyltransferase [Pseudomonadota bacterium]
MSARLAEQGEAPVLAAVHGRVFPFGAWDQAFWQTALDAAYDLPFLLGDPPRALALLRVLGPEAEVITIGTAEPRRGDGTALLGVMTTHGLALGAKRLFLEVSALNSTAQRFYRHAGFVQHGRRSHYYSDGSDALLLSLDLAP